MDNCLSQLNRLINNSVNRALHSKQGERRLRRPFMSNLVLSRPQTANGRASDDDEMAAKAAKATRKQCAAAAAGTTPATAVCSNFI